MKRAAASSGIIILAYIAFISLGLPDGLHGVAWPSIRGHFDLPLDALGLLLVFGTAGYMISSFLSGMLMRILGLGKLLSISCLATGLTLLSYAFSPVWVLFAASAFLGGLGAGAIDAGLNTYVAQNHSEHHMQWLHAFFGVGITLGPVIMTAGLALTGSYNAGYLYVGLAQLALAALFMITRTQWERSNGVKDMSPTSPSYADTPQEATGDVSEAGLLETLGNYRALLSMLMFFVYTGVELGLGIWSFSLLTESRGVAPATAGFITTSYWGMFTAGRMLAGFYTRKLKAQTLVLLSILLALAGTGLLWLNAGIGLSVAGVALTGFAIAPIFPGMVSDTRTRVGSRHEANTIGMQIGAAGFGAAIIPSIAGVLARNFGLEIIPPYIFISLVLLVSSFMFTHVHRHREE